MQPDHYDLIVVGSGPGGASLAQRLAPGGKRILILERGGYLPRSEQNWDSKTVFVDGAYQADETWTNRQGRDVQARAALLCRRQFQGLWRGAVPVARARLSRRGSHAGGDFAGLASRLRRVRALLHRGGNAFPRPRRTRRRSRWSLAPARPYPHPPVSHEPKIENLSDRSSQASGSNRFTCPSASCWTRKAASRRRPASACAAARFDGFPCLLNGKADAQVICIDPMLAATSERHDVDRRLCLTAGDRLRWSNHPDGARDARRPVRSSYSADIVVVACGALSSALLLLRSARTISIRTASPTAPIRWAATTCVTR